MRSDTKKGKAITLDEMKALVTEELARCTTEQVALFAKISIEPIKIRFDRGAFSEDVFAVAQTENKLIIYDDIENGFEVGTPDADGIIRNLGTGQFELRHVLAHLKLGWR